MKMQKMRFRGIDDQLTALQRAEKWLSDPVNIARAHKITIRAAGIEARTNINAMQQAANSLPVKFKERMKK